jgi:Ulp1 family protease
LWTESGQTNDGYGDRDFDEINLPLIQVTVPQQDNSTDCGVYLLSFVESFLRGGYAVVDDLHPSVHMGFPWYTNGGKLGMAAYFNKKGHLPLDRRRVRR